MIKERINSVYISWFGETEITEMEKTIENLKKLGATHIEFDYDGMEIKPLIKRLETDVEYKIRTEEEEMRKQRILNKEREEYLRLKQKFENDNK